MKKNIRYWSNSIEFLSSLKKYALSDEKAKECYEKGIIIPQINNTILKEYDVGFQFYIRKTYPQIEKEPAYYRKGVYLKFWYSYLASLGIKMFFIEQDNFPEDIENSCIYITDFHLIFSKRLEYTWTGLGEPKIYKKPKEVLIIPLNKIKNLELKSHGEKNYYSEGYSYIKEGSPVMGAIMGGAIAGSTGAVVGALANQTKVVNVPRRDRIFEEYSLIIKLDDNKVLEFETISIRKYVEQAEHNKSGTLEGKKKLSNISINEPQYSDDSIKMINERLNFLLCRAKNKYSDEEMSNIVNQTIEHSIEFNKKVEQDEKKSLIFGCIFFAVIFIIFTIFQLYS